MTKPIVVVVGGGAAGFFAAITAAEAGASVTLLERGSSVLGKVKISGGGRCNLTHACYNPKQLVQNYPRGSRELLGPFHRFQPRDTLVWFENRGVQTKTESDGRVFPTTDQSQTIVDALTRSARVAGVVVRTNLPALVIEKGVHGFSIKEGDALWKADRLLIATGSGSQGYRWAQDLGHTIVPPVPSLFTFSVSDPRLKGLAGVAVPHAQLILDNTTLSSTGPLLITHQGLSGPAVLKLSAWSARILSERGYKAGLRINWLGIPELEARKKLREMKQVSSRQKVRTRSAFPVPHRLWERLSAAAISEPDRRWAELSTIEEDQLVAQFVRGEYAVVGKGTFKEEFVTAGGVALNEVNFSTMESRTCPGLYFAGEILDIDGLTGGFNFQSAWTTGWLAGRAMAAE